jgi:hypothetical protein
MYGAARTHPQLVLLLSVLHYDRELRLRLPSVALLIQKNLNQLPIDVHVALGLLKLPYLPQDQEGHKVHRDDVVAVSVFRFV